MPKELKENKILFKKILEDDIDFAADKTVLSRGFELTFREKEAKKFILNLISNSKLADLGVINQELARNFFFQNLKSKNLVNLLRIYELVKAERSF